MIPEHEIRPERYSVYAWKHKRNGLSGYVGSTSNQVFDLVERAIEKEGKKAMINVIDNNVGSVVAFGCFLQGRGFVLVERNGGFRSEY